MQIFAIYMKCLIPKEKKLHIEEGLFFNMVRKATESSTIQTSKVNASFRLDVQ